MTRPEQATLPDPEAVTLRPAAVIRDQFDEAASMYVHEPDKLRALGSHMRELAGADKRCGTCRWWGGSDDAKDREAAVTGVKVLLRCQAIRHPEERTYFDVAPDLPDNFSKAYVMDASGYTAALNTAADFSCALWTAAKGGG